MASIFNAWFRPTFLSGLTGQFHIDSLKLAAAAVFVGVLALVFAIRLLAHHDHHEKEE